MSSGIAVLVTGIGGNVAQGIARIVRARYPDLRIVGTSVYPVTGGNHLCDAVHVVPWASNDAYPDAIREISETESVRLVIPATDLESAVLADLSGLPPVAGSPAATTATCLDKWRTHEVLTSAGSPFAASVLPSGWDGRFERTVVKPRSGRGSRDVHFDPVDPGSFDDSFVVQEFLEGTEITSAFYVLASGDVHGAITMERDLDAAGTTVACRVESRYDDAIARLIESLTAALEIRGSCNVQSKVTADGIVPFEINCRVSGTNSVRHHFGFEDVVWTIEEWLYGVKPARLELRPGAAQRLLMDVIYPGLSSDVVPTRDTPHVVF